MNYLECLGRSFPNVRVSCIGSPTVYTNLRVEEGSDPLPVVEDLEAQNFKNLQEDMWYAIEAERDRRYEVSGTPVEYNGETLWFHSDFASKQKQIALAMVAGTEGLPEYPEIRWRMMNKQYVVMTNELAGLIFKHAIMRENEIFQAADNHRYAMLTVVDPTAYDFSSGWPEMFSDNHTVTTL